MAPAAVAIVGVVASAAGAAYSAYAQKQAGDFQAAIAKRNADAAEKAARDAAERGLNEGVRVGLVGGATRGAIRAGFGASGVDVGTGSPLDILSDAAMFNELDKQTARSNASREAFSARFQAGNYLAQGSLDKTRGRSNAAGTILSGAAQAYGDYYGATH